MGGDGGDAGYEVRQQQLEDKKQSAREALNQMFGVGTAAQPSRDQFTKASAPVRTFVSGGEDGGYWLDQPALPATFDQAGFDAAQAKYQASLDQGHSRDALYQGVRDNTYNAGKARIDEQNTDAARKLKFELFARGLNGGSEDVNQNALRQRTYSQGLMDLGAKADAAKAGFRGNDESTRLALLQSIDAGMDQGSALTSAASQMQVNADKAASEANGSAVGDLFANTGLIYNRSQASQGKQAGTDWWNQYSASRKSPALNNGTITSTG